MKNPFKKSGVINFGELIYVKQLNRNEVTAWPFNAEYVKVACIEHDYAVIEISGTVYALNGLAATYFKLKSIQQTEFYKTVEVEGTEDENGKKQVVGVHSLQPIINAALFLDPENKLGERIVFNTGT